MSIRVYESLAGTRTCSTTSSGPSAERRKTEADVWVMALMVTTAQQMLAILSCCCW